MEEDIDTEAYDAAAPGAESIRTNCTALSYIFKKYATEKHISAAEIDKKDITQTRSGRHL